MHINKIYSKSMKMHWLLMLKTLDANRWHLLLIDETNKSISKGPKNWFWQSFVLELTLFPPTQLVIQHLPRYSKLREYMRHKGICSLLESRANILMVFNEIREYFTLLRNYIPLYRTIFNEPIGIIYNNMRLLVLTQLTCTRHWYAGNKEK
jgi:hypothetical protein